MSQYALLFIGGERPPSPAAMDAEMKKWIAWSDALRAKGQMKSGEPLERTGKAVRGRSKAVTDGPYAEAKDVVGGFMIVEARSLEEAVEIAKGCPILDVDGAVEVRPVLMRAQ